MVKFEPNSKHPLYQKWASKWFRQRCLLEGEDRIKEDDVAETFLPRLEGQLDQSSMDLETNQPIISSYVSYKGRASLYNGVSRTRDGLVGAIMRKEPVVIWPKSEVDALETIGHAFDSLQEVINDTLDEVIGVGRYGHLVDVGEDASPYIVAYFGENITDWEEGRVRGRRQTTRVHLKEKSDLYSVTNDSYELEQYRILWLGVPQPHTEAEKKMAPAEFLASVGLSNTDLEQGPVYFQEVWREADRAVKSSDKTWVRVSLTVPRRLGGAVWNEIPFVFYNSTNTRARPEKPALLDIAVVNIGHYRNSADKEHGLHFTGLPQPWLAGFKFKQHLFIGSGAAWVSEDPQAKAGYLEVQNDFAALDAEMERKEKRMASLGARILEEQAPAGSQEAMGTVKIRQSGERSVLARMSICTSTGLSKVLQFVRMFKGETDPKVGITLNMDFGVENLDPNMLKALMEAVQQGLMSWESFVHNAKRGELYPDGWDKDKEAGAIKVGIPGRSLEDLLNPQPDPSGAAGDGDGDTPPKPKKAKKPKKTA